MGRGARGRGMNVSLSSATSCFRSYAGYDNCLELRNDETRLILGPHCGGRVLSYQFRGREALYLDPAQNGWIQGPDSPEMSALGPTGGRADVGPESDQPPRPTLWLGPWDLEAGDDGSAEMTSRRCPDTGLRVQRRFELEGDTSRVRFTQTLRNEGSQPARVCHWGRTFGRGGGICVIPLKGKRSYDYIRFDPGGIATHPPDPAIRVREGCVEVLGPPLHAKLGFDTKAEWFAVAQPSDLLFVKRYSVPGQAEYGDSGGMTVSIYIKDDRLCELEPIGPMHTLSPGEEASFIENWELLPFAFPSKGENLDLGALKNCVDPTNSKRWN